MKVARLGSPVAVAQVGLGGTSAGCLGGAGCLPCPRDVTYALDVSPSSKVAPAVTKTAANEASTRVRSGAGDHGLQIVAVDCASVMIARDEAGNRAPPASAKARECSLR